MGYVIVFVFKTTLVRCREKSYQLRTGVYIVSRVFFLLLLRRPDRINFVEDTRRQQRWRRLTITTVSSSSTFTAEERCDDARRVPVERERRKSGKMGGRGCVVSGLATSCAVGPHVRLKAKTGRAASEYKYAGRPAIPSLQSYSSADQHHQQRKN